MSILEVYHDECGDIISTMGVFSTLGVIMSTLGNTKMHVGVIMSNRGMFSTPEGYHEYNGGCSVHWRDTMSTPGDFGTTEKKLLHISRIFVLTSFVTMQVYMLAFETSDSLLRFFLSGRQSPDPNIFLVSSLIKGFVLKSISRREAIGIYIVYDIKPQITLQLG